VGLHSLGPVGVGNFAWKLNSLWSDWLGLSLLEATIVLCAPCGHYDCHLSVTNGKQMWLTVMWLPAISVLLMLFILMC